MDLKDLLATNVRKLRANLQMTQEQLAVKAKVKIGVIRAVEIGRSWPEAQNMLSIARALDVTPAFLLAVAEEQGFLQSARHAIKYRESEQRSVALLHELEKRQLARERDRAKTAASVLSDENKRREALLGEENKRMDAMPSEENKKEEALFFDEFLKSMEARLKALEDRMAPVSLSPAEEATVERLRQLGRQVARKKDAG